MDLVIYKYLFDHTSFIRIQDLLPYCKHTATWSLLLSLHPSSVPASSGIKDLDILWWVFAFFQPLAALNARSFQLKPTVHVSHSTDMRSKKHRELFTCFIREQCSGRDTSVCKPLWPGCEPRKTYIPYWQTACHGKCLNFFGINWLRTFIKPNVVMSESLMNLM